MKPDLSLRQHELDLVKSINRSTSVEADHIRKLVALRYEAAKEKLVNGDGPDMLKLQGEAQCLKKLYNDLTRTLNDPQE